MRASSLRFLYADVYEAYRELYTCMNTRMYVCFTTLSCVFVYECLWQRQHAMPHVVSCMQTCCTIHIKTRAMEIWSGTNLCKTLVMRLCAPELSKCVFIRPIYCKCVRMVDLLMAHAGRKEVLWVPLFGESNEDSKRTKYGIYE